MRGHMWIHACHGSSTSWKLQADLKLTVLVTALASIGVLSSLLVFRTH
jgi:hypothetical protein